MVDHGTHVSEWGGATHRAGPGAIIVNNPGDVQTGAPVTGTDVVIAQVAAAAGFADQSHLSRHFKRLVGVPPG